MEYYCQIIGKMKQVVKFKEISERMIYVYDKFEQ